MSFRKDKRKKKLVCCTCLSCSNVIFVYLLYTKGSTRIAKKFIFHFLWINSRYCFASVVYKFKHVSNIMKKYLERLLAALLKQF